MQKLRLQLISLLILAVLLPSLPVALTTHELIGRSLDPLLETGIEDGARAGLEILRQVLEREKEAFSASLRAREPADTLTAEQLAALDPRERSALEAWGKLEGLEDPAGKAGGIRLSPRRMPLGGREVLVTRVGPPAGPAAWVVRPLTPELSERAGRLTGSLRLLQSFRRERTNLVRSLLATFLVVYGAVVLIVLGLGLYLASRVTRPMAVLGRGIDQVADGRLETRVEEVGGGEMRRLLRHFNEMAARLRSQQAEVVRLEKLAAWRQMARRLAHEIKNPLTPIQLSAQQIRDEGKGSDPEYRQLVEETTGIIEEEVQRLRTLVSQFSQFARLPEPQTALVPVSEILSELQGLYGEEKVAVSLPPDDDRIELVCDRDQIHRALINLVNNALAAQEEVGRSEPVEVAVAEPTAEGTVRIEVRDRGPGVPESERRRIFEPDVTTKPDGMGLGLPIVESTLRNHGGSVAVGDREGGGAIFTLTLPAGPRPGDGERS